MSKKKQIADLKATVAEKEAELADARTELDAATEDCGSGLATVEPNGAVNEAAAALALEVGKLTGVIPEEQTGGQGWEVRTGNDAPCPIIEIPEAIQNLLNLPAPLRENGGVVILVGTIPQP